MPPDAATPAQAPTAPAPGPPGDDVAVTCRAVTKVYGEPGNQVTALRGVNLDARFGEILLLVGPSGCGKTTLLSVVAGILDRTSGDVRVFGSDLHLMSAAEKTEFRKRNIGFIFQQYNLLPTLTAAENVAVPLLIHGIQRRLAIERAVEELEAVGLGDRVTSFPRDLSGGQQQRIAIARALVASPRLIVCDEPTANLDGDTGAKIMEMLKRVAVSKDRCVLLVTHDTRVFPYGDRIAQMLDGRIVGVRAVEKDDSHGTR